MDFRILGPLEARDGDVSLPLGPKKQRALLAALLLDANKTVSLDRLVEQLWGDEPPDTAAKVIQTHVSRLRKVLPDGMLRTRAPGYVLEIEGGELDLDRFERLCVEARRARTDGHHEHAAEALAAALALWRGPALAEFSSEPFSLTEGARLEKLRLAALEDRLDAELALGWHADVVVELESLVASHPLRERLRAQLMIALYRSGRQADALAVYSETRRILVQQLGIEPSRELRELERAVLRHDPALELPDDRRESPDSSAPRAADGLGTFVGREPELARLRGALEAALDGHGRLVMLAGEPGIGKTRIALELAHEAGERGARVVWGRCFARVSAPPYWPWLQAIRAYVDVCDPGRLRAELGAGAAAVAEVVPEVSESLGGLQPPEPLPDEKQARFRLLDSIASFLKRAAANRPLVVVLEDLDAADAGSLGLLEFVAQEIEQAPLLLLGAYRDVDLTRGHPLTQTLAELMRERPFERLTLRGLSEQDVARFIEAATGVSPPAELVAMVSRRTEGNPLFVTQFVELLEREGSLRPATLGERQDWNVRLPEGLRDVMGRRLDRLSERCNEVLRVASVLGREFRLEQLTRLIQGSEDELVETLEEALGARVIEELSAAGSYRFTHALFQEALSGELSTTRRIRLHARIVAALEALYGAGVGGHAAELAYHSAEAETVLGSERLVKYSRLAGEQAFAAHAYEDAIAHFQRALATREGEPMDDESADLLVALVRSEFLGRQRYDLDDALERLRQAFDYYVGAGDTPNAVELAAYPIPPVWGATDVPELLSTALTMVPADSLDAGCILANAGRFLGTNDGDYDAANEALERSLAIARAYGDTALERRALALAARVDWWHMRWDQCVARSTRALELAQAVDDQQTELYARSWLVRDAATRGSTGEARDHAKACLELADRLRERYWVATARVNAFWLASLEGDWEAARSFSDAGLRVQPRDARNLGLRALLEHELGEPGEGDLYAQRLVDAMRATEAGSNVEHAEAAAVIALVGLITARPESFGEAEAAARTVVSASIRLPIFDVCARVGLGVIAHERGDAASALEQYGALVDQAGTLLILLGMAADRLLGRLAFTKGDLDNGCTHFEAALSLCDHAGYRPEYARTALDYAEALRHRAAPGDLERAAFLHHEGLSIVRELGMRGLEKRMLARAPAGAS